MRDRTDAVIPPCRTSAQAVCPKAKRRLTAVAVVAALAASLAQIATLLGGDTSAMNGGAAGSAIGDYVPQFYTRVVTGPLMNRSVCYVCRYGERPVVMVLMRQVGPELRPLLRNIDRIVEQHRARGLRSVGVYVSDQSFPAISTVQTFAFNNHVDMPLTIGTEAVAEETCQNLSADAAVTVVFYNRRRIVERFAFRSEELDVAHFTPVVEKLKGFAAAHGAAAPAITLADETMADRE